MAQSSPSAADDLGNPRVPFSQIQKLTLDPEIELYLREHAGDPTKFLEGIEPATTPQSLLNNLQHAILQIKASTLPETKFTQVRRLFLYLMLFDVCAMIKQKNPPDQRDGPLTLTELSNSVGCTTTAAGVGAAQILPDMNKYSQHGAVLHSFCTEFGTGSLFYLVDYLTDEFLSSNPFGPEYVGQGPSYMELLGLKAKAEKH